jgi:hypothetical protein
MQVIEIVGKSFKRYCQFDLSLMVQDNGKTIPETVSNNGKPFKVSGLLPPKRYAEVFEGGVCGVSGNGDWARVNPRKARSNGRYSRTAVLMTEMTRDQDTLYALLALAAEHNAASW